MPVRAGLAAALLLVALALVPAPASALQDGGADIEVTRTGSLANIVATSSNADIAYNSKRDEYLSVFASRPGTPPLNADEIEIFGRRLNAAGEPLGDAFRISNLGVDGNANANAADPAVAYSPASDSYLVVFSGDSGVAPYVDDKIQIWSRLVSGDGTLAGTSDQLISNIGSNLDASNDAEHPDVAWNTAANTFLVVFDTPVLAPGAPANKIYSHRVGPDGNAIGSDIFVSETEPQSGADSATGYPGVAGNTNDGTWLVAWTAEPNPGNNAHQELEFFGRLISTLGNRIGNDFRITQTGDEGDGEANAAPDNPALAFNPTTNEFLLVWTGDKGYPAAVNTEFEILGQRVAAAGVRERDTIRISEIGPEYSNAGSTFGYDVTYSPVSNEFLAIWSGDHATGNLVNDEYEIFGQRLTGTAAPIGSDFRIGQTGPDGDTATRATRPAIAAGASGQYVGVWDGRPAGIKNEIYADRLFTPIVSIGDGSAVESSGQLLFPVSLVHPDPAAVPVSVLAATTPGSATAGPDYIAGTSIVTVFPGSSTSSFPVALVADRNVEPPEQIGARIHSPQNALLGTTTATGTIADDSVPLPPAPPPKPPAKVVPQPAKIQVRRAQIVKGRLDALLQITSRATGTLRIAYTSSGRTTRFDISLGGASSSAKARAAERQILIDRKLPSSQSRKSTGILNITYAGNERVRPDEVRLRAATGKALLKRTTTSLKNGTLKLAGTISSKAVGVVRIRLSYLDKDDEAKLLKYRARIKRSRKGASTWSLNQKLPSAAAAGGQADIQFTGYEKRRIRGEQLSKEVP